MFFFVESKLETFWNVVLDADKMIFTNEKFLSQASDDGKKKLTKNYKIFFNKSLYALRELITSSVIHFCYI